MSSIQNSYYRNFYALITQTPTVEKNDGHQIVQSENLKSAYNGFCSEIQENIRHFSSKGQYIFYLKNRLNWIRNVLEDNFIESKGQVLESSSGNVYKSIQDESGDKDLIISNVFVKTQLNYAKRAVEVISELIETVIRVNSEDLFLKPAGRINKGTSTPESPLAFFIDFYTREGLSGFRASFEPTVEDYENLDIQYNAEEESRTTWFTNPENGEVEENKEFFSDKLSEKISHEFRNYMNSIDLKIDEISKNKEETSNYLVVQLARIREIKKGIEKNILGQKYEVNKNIASILAEYILEQYKLYIPSEVLYELNDIYKTSFVPLTQKLTFTIKSKEFVELFGKLIKEKKLMLKDTSDVQPIVETLSSFFNIPKSRGKGFIQTSSLHTEFKEYMAPPTKAKSRK